MSHHSTNVVHESHGVTSTMPVIQQVAGTTQEHVHSHHFATQNIGTIIAPVMAEHAH